MQTVLPQVPAPKTDSAVDDSPTPSRRRRAGIAQLQPDHRAPNPEEGRGSNGQAWRCVGWPPTGMSSYGPHRTRNALVGSRDRPSTRAPNRQGRCPPIPGLRPQDSPERAGTPSARIEDGANGNVSFRRPATPVATLAGEAEAPPYGGGNPDTKEDQCGDTTQVPPHTLECGRGHISR